MVTQFFSIFEQFRKLFTDAFQFQFFEKIAHFQREEIRSHDNTIFQHLQNVSALRALGGDVETFKTKSEVKEKFLVATLMKRSIVKG